ncbi:hypothetical protein V8C40DRAFT_237363 [Trichoderma camerunense]
MLCTDLVGWASPRRTFFSPASQRGRGEAKSMVNQAAEWSVSPCRCPQVAGATEQDGDSLARHRNDTPLSPSLSLSLSLSAAEVALAAVKMEDNGMGVSNLWQAAKRPDSLVVLQHSALLSRGGQR